MYPQVDYPKGDPSEEWLKQAFAPLRAYLDRHHPDEADNIIVYLMFMGNENERFYYKNSVSRAPIIFDQAGELVSLADGALEYKFEEYRLPKRKTPQTSIDHTHPNVMRWLEKKLRKEDERVHFEEVRLFLQELWGPVCNYDFDDLKVGYPIRGTRVQHCLYIYPVKFEKLMAFQFPGDEIIERTCGHLKYNEFRWKEQELRLQGWMVVCYWKEHLETDLSILTDYLSKFIENADRRDPLFVRNG